MLDKLLEALKGFFKKNEIDISGKEDVLKSELEKLIDENGSGENIDLSKLDLSKLNNNDGTKQLIETLINNNKALEAKLNDTFEKIGKMMSSEEARQKAIEEEAKAKLKKKVETAVEGLIKSGKFAESKKDYLTKLAESDFESFENLTKDLKTDKHFKDDETNTGGTSTTTTPATEKVSPLKTLTEAIKSEMGEE